MHACVCACGAGNSGCCCLLTALGHTGALIRTRDTLTPLFLCALTNRNGGCGQAQLMLYRCVRLCHREGMAVGMRRVTKHNTFLAAASFFCKSACEVECGRRGLVRLPSNPATNGLRPFIIQISTVHPSSFYAPHSAP